MRVSIQKLTGDTVCAGAHVGHLVLVKLLGEVNREHSVPELVFLDFADVEIATASFLRESVLAFRDFVRQQRPTYYPLLANANVQVSEELKMLLDLQGGALLACELDIGNQTTNIQLLGRLEGKQQLAFKLVGERGETDAAQLQLEFGENEGVKQTAWNNRLAALAASGLIIETSRGRAKRYRSLLGGVYDGC
ncbi:STAS-like domain-containing protein [Starkeya sp. ORNL1]|uniref:hypothetical protein n=1 Tax=Starkeya sp. ORNL1 TaxID=2709380 RepID=UPI0014632423|nr:hypothetical protein [Starkeya sp. ORNL1]QJP13631.1 STAS-like domain-containing protein [Starkeya sp. ORNL1]